MELQAQGMTAAEWTAIETLFQATGGMWKSFTLLDPVGNLLVESETLGASSWINGPLLSLTPGAVDPFGTARGVAIANSGSAIGAVTQTLSIPGTFHYTLSVWARSDTGAGATLAIASTGAAARKAFQPGLSWQRFSLTAHLAVDTETLTFGIELEPGGSIVLFGMQAEAQLASSDYKRTGTKAGVHANARFATDTISVTTQSTDVYDASLRIVSMET